MENILNWGQKGFLKKPRHIWNVLPIYSKMYKHLCVCPTEKDMERKLTRTASWKRIQSRILVGRYLRRPRGIYRTISHSYFLFLFQQSIYLYSMQRSTIMRSIKYIGTDRQTQRENWSESRNVFINHIRLTNRDKTYRNLLLLHWKHRTLRHV